MFEYYGIIVADLPSFVSQKRKKGVLYAIEEYLTIKDDTPLLVCFYGGRRGKWA